MKQSDFDRLKAVCEKEGFRLESFPGINTIQVFKKDIWEGVEFVDRKTPTWPICKVFKITENNVEYFVEDRGKVWCGKEFLHPSTEQAYREQLKSEAFKRFGEINDTFLFGFWKCEKDGFNGYIKDRDEYYVLGACIYNSGKWATKLPERVKVISASVESIGINKEFVFKLSENKYVDYKTADFLASKFEEYLNKES